MDSETLSLITIPLFTGAIGYVTNLSGVWMLFYPVRFAGSQSARSLVSLANLMPRRIQQIPGLGQGGLRLAGNRPLAGGEDWARSRSTRGSPKLGGPGDFYRQLDAEAIAEQILTTARGEIHDVVERIMERDHPQLWHDLPPRLRASGSRARRGAAARPSSARSPLRSALTSTACST